MFWPGRNFARRSEVRFAAADARSSTDVGIAASVAIACSAMAASGSATAASGSATAAASGSATAASGSATAASGSATTAGSPLATSPTGTSATAAIIGSASEASTASPASTASTGAAASAASGQAGTSGIGGAGGSATCPFVEGAAGASVIRASRSRNSDAAASASASASGAIASGWRSETGQADASNCTASAETSGVSSGNGAGRISWPRCGAHVRQRPSTWFQQLPHVYWRQVMQKLNVEWNASSWWDVSSRSSSLRAAAIASSIDVSSLRT